jgi:hypothetical protein
MLAARRRDRAYRSAGIDPKEGPLAIDLDPQKEVILFRTLEGQGLEYRILKLGPWALVVRTEHRRRASQDCEGGNEKLAPTGV